VEVTLPTTESPPFDPTEPVLAAPEPPAPTVTGVGEPGDGISSTSLKPPAPPPPPTPTETFSTPPPPPPAITRASKVAVAGSNVPLELNVVLVQHLL